MEAADVGEESGRASAEGARGADVERSGRKKIAGDTAVEAAVDGEEGGSRTQDEVICASSCLGWYDWL